MGSLNDGFARAAAYLSVRTRARAFNAMTGQVFCLGRLAQGQKQ